MNNDPRNYFYNQRNTTTQDTTTSQKTTSATTGDKAIDEKVKQMQALAKKYEKAGESQLIKDIVANVIEQKAKGQLTNDQLVAFAKKVSPLLNAEQRQRLNSLVAELIKL